MHVVDASRTGTLVEVVDVLGAEIEAVAEVLFDLCQREVCGVGVSGQGILPTHRVETPD